jgi:hypothetical protein
MHLDDRELRAMLFLLPAGFLPLSARRLPLFGSSSTLDSESAIMGCGTDPDHSGHIMRAGMGLLTRGPVALASLPGLAAVSELRGWYRGQGSHELPRGKLQLHKRQGFAAKSAAAGTGALYCSQQGAIGRDL